MPEKISNVTQRLKAMTPSQQRRIFTLRNRICECEGAEMPYKYWCKSCKTTWQKLNDVFVKFEKVNSKQIQAYEYNTYTHEGFSEYDSTERGYE